MFDTCTPAVLQPGHGERSVHARLDQVFAEENRYIGPTLDRLDETALVLNDELGNPRATSTATSGTPRQGSAAVKQGTLSLKVKCAGAGKVKLTGTLTQLTGARPRHGKQKSKTYKLGPVNGTVKVGKSLTLMVKLPAAAVTALGNGAKVSATFTAALTGPAGAGRATANIATLKATR